MDDAYKELVQELESYDPEKPDWEAVRGFLNRIEKMNPPQGKALWLYGKALSDLIELKKWPHKADHGEPNYRYWWYSTAPLFDNRVHISSVLCNDTIRKVGMTKRETGELPARIGCPTWLDAVVVLWRSGLVFKKDDNPPQNQEKTPSPSISGIFGGFRGDVS